ncbi:dihydrofolate reductase family protein [Embleya scabrispora]|uniref:dihydrofolate reductase family protein n=1 Tax=Embleya scabrispora TaxID=159449 RepID=UPI00039AEBBF|nr:dihydrofolate reductase family protein [Embleya scabrispora]MYS87342.1 deaminase [Streptomyces sp. SID5474]
MATVMAEKTMSLDGFIADPSGGVAELFDWYSNGNVETPAPGGGMTFRTSEASARHLRELVVNTAAVVTGRRLFDLTDGWGGSHPIGVPVFVVTHHVPEDWVAAHPHAPFTFVTTGVEHAVAQARAVAGDLSVGVGGADIVRQCLNAGLVDEIVVNLVPVLLGSGIRFFDHLADTPIELAATRVIEGRRVTHLYFRVVRQG